MDVTKLVQEEGFVEALGRVEKDRSSECNARNVRGAECPSSDAQGKPADAKARVQQLGKLFS